MGMREQCRRNRFGSECCGGEDEWKGCSYWEYGVPYRKYGVWGCRNGSLCVRLVGLRHRGCRVGSSLGGNRPGRPGRLFHRGGQVGHALGGDPPERGRLCHRGGQVGHALSGNPLGQRGRLLLRSRRVGHVLGVDPRTLLLWWRWWWRGRRWYWRGCPLYLYLYLL